MEKMVWTNHLYSISLSKHPEDCLKPILGGCRLFDWIPLIFIYESMISNKKNIESHVIHYLWMLHPRLCLRIVVSRYLSLCFWCFYLFCFVVVCVFLCVWLLCFTLRCFIFVFVCFYLFILFYLRISRAPQVPRVPRFPRIPRAPRISRILRIPRIPRIPRISRESLANQNIRKSWIVHYLWNYDFDLLIYDLESKNQNKT